jgi:hypothetical protein
MTRAGTRGGWRERAPRVAGTGSAGQLRTVHDPGLAAAIYGQIVTTGTVAAVAVDDALPAGDVLATVAASILVLWAAHLYAEALAHGGSVTHARAVVGRFKWPILETAVPTLVVLALAALGVISRRAAVITAEAFGAVVLFGLVALVARRSGASLLKTLLFATLGATFGLAIAVVKSAVH